MAAGKADLGHSQGFLEALAVPRPVSRIALALACLGISQALWHFLNIKLLAFASGQAVAVGTMCLAAVWGFREKATDILGSDELNADDLDAGQRAARQLGSLSIRRALWVALCLSLTGSAAVSAQLAGFVMQWMVLVGGVGLAECLYAFWITAHLSQQLREWRDAKRLQNVHAVELKSQIERFNKSSPMPGQDEDADTSAVIVSGTLVPADR